MTNALRHELKKSLLVGLLLMIPSTGSAQATQQSAQSHLDRGLQFAAEQKLPEALVELQQSYDIDHDPATLYSIGNLYVALQMPVEAVRVFERYLAAVGANISPEREHEVKSLLDEERALAANTQIGETRAPFHLTPITYGGRLGFDWIAVKAASEERGVSNGGSLSGGVSLLAYELLALNADFALGIMGRSGAAAMDQSSPGFGYAFLLHGSVGLRSPRILLAETLSPWVLRLGGNLGKAWAAASGTTSQGLGQAFEVDGETYWSLLLAVGNGETGAIRGLAVEYRHYLASPFLAHTLSFTVGWY